jgi:hypothetical protein
MFYLAIFISLVLLCRALRSRWCGWSQRHVWDDNWQWDQRHSGRVRRCRRCRLIEHELRF